MCNLLSWRLILEEEKKADWFHRLPKEAINHFLESTSPLYEIKHPKSQIQSFQLSGESIISTSSVWGIKPSWCPDYLTNTKSEKLVSSPFWNQFINNRILIPVHSFFEWQTQNTGKNINSKLHSNLHILTSLGYGEKKGECVGSQFSLVKQMIK